MHHAIERPRADGRPILRRGRPDGDGGRPVAASPPARGRATQRSRPSVNVDPDTIRPDLAETIARHAIGLDAARPDAVERRRARSAGAPRARTSPISSTKGSFVEYGPVVIAAQRRRRPVEDLIERTPADGMIGGIGTVNGDLFAGHAAQVHRRVVRLHRAGRHAGQAEPSQEGPAVRARRSDAPAGRVLHRGRRRPARRHRRRRRQRARLLGVQLLRVSSAVWCRSSASTPGTASPATRRSSAAATW